MRRGGGGPEEPLPGSPARPEQLPVAGGRCRRRLRSQRSLVRRRLGAQEPPGRHCPGGGGRGTPPEELGKSSESRLRRQLRSPPPPPPPPRASERGSGTGRFTGARGDVTGHRSAAASRGVLENCGGPRTRTRTRARAHVHCAGACPSAALLTRTPSSALDRAGSLPRTHGLFSHTHWNPPEDAAPAATAPLGAHPHPPGTAPAPGLAPEDTPPHRGCTYPITTR